MEGGALLDPKFKEFSKSHVMLLSVMTKIDDRKNDDLLGEKGFRGFPSFAILDAGGDVIAKNLETRDVAELHPDVVERAIVLALDELKPPADVVASERQRLVTELRTLERELEQASRAASLSDSP